MTTYNEKVYSGSADGNAAIWFNPCSSCLTVNYVLSMFIPKIDTTTNNAVYQVDYGGSPTLVKCPLAQSPYYNVWVGLCGAGLFDMNSSGDVVLNDGTGEPNGSKLIGFDNNLWQYCGTGCVS